MNNKIWNSFVSESVRDQTDAAASDFMPFGDIFLLGLASVLNLLRFFLLLKVGSFLLSLYEELLSTMFERLLGSSGIVAGEVVPLIMTAFLSARLILRELPQIGRHKHAGGGSPFRASSLPRDTWCKVPSLKVIMPVMIEQASPACLRLPIGSDAPSSEVALRLPPH